MFNALNNKLGQFPFHYKLTKAKNDRYNGTCMIVFGLSINKRKFTTQISDEDNSDKSSIFSTEYKHPKIINISKVPEKLKWNKLLSFLRKIILYASSNLSKALDPSEDFVELLNCNSDKIGLLLIYSVAMKERNTFSIQQNLISNIRKGLLIGQ